MIVHGLKQYFQKLTNFRWADTRRKRTTRSGVGHVIECIEDRTLLSAGTLDAGFGNLGRVVTDLTAVSGVAADVANSVAIQSDGKYVVAGSSTTVISQGILTRYNANGTLDTSFGAGGSVASSFFIDGFQDLAILSDGSIVVTGQVNDTAFNSYFGVLKVTPSGLLDQNFGINGLAVVDFTPQGYINEFPHALVAQGTNIVVVGEGESPFGDLDMLVARFGPDGNLDNTFNGNGKQFVAFNLAFGFKDDIANDVTIDNNNKVVLAGSVDFGDLDFGVARLTNTGILDTTFDGDGKKNIDFGNFNDEEAFAVAVEPGGNIVLGGYTVSNTNFTDDFGLARLNNLGVLSAGFGTGGLKAIDFGNIIDLSNDRIHDLRVQGTQVVVAGFSDHFTGVLPDEQFALARVNLSDGSLDPSLDPSTGNGGRVTTTFFADAVASANSLAIDSSGNYVVVGSSGGLGGSTQNWALARYLSNGTLDTTFGNQARVLTDQSFWNGISHDQAASAITLPDGRIVVSGTSSLLGGSTYGVLSCYLPNGVLDPTFGQGGEIASPFFAGGFQDLVALPDGSIFAAGQVQDGSGNRFLGVLKVTPNGFVDQNFGIRGLAVADFGSMGYTDEFAHALTLQGTNIVVAGEGVSPFGDKDMLVARFSPDGNLDNTFNGTGLRAVVFNLAFGLQDDIAYDVTIDNNNKIVLAGSVEFGDLDFGIARLTNTGILDSTFDGDGKKNIDFGFFNDEEAFSVVVEPGGNIVLGGYTISNTNFTEDFALVRMNNLGALTAGFGNGGLKSTDFGNIIDLTDDRIRDIRLQGNQVVAAGSSADFTGILRFQTFALARYNLSDGSLDPNLDLASGNGGRIRTSFFATTISTANAITFDASGNYILVGSSGDGFLADNFALAKYQQNGTIDTAFGNQGRVLTDFSPVVGPDDSGTSVTVAADGKIVVSALSQSFFGNSGVIVRYNADGSLDQSFGTGGLVGSALFPLGFSDLIVLSDGSIIAAGQVVDTAFNTYFGVLKLDPNGLVDQNFGIRGLAIADFGAMGYTDEVPHAIALQGTSIVVAGEGLSPFFDLDMLVARFAADGNLDNTFNGTGLQAVAFNLAFGFQNDIANDVTIDNNNKIVLAGSVDFGDLDFGIARLTNTGILDTTFDGDGKKNIDFGFFNDEEAFSVVVEPGGNIVLGGYTISNTNFSEDFALVRMNNLGSLSSGFGNGGLLTTDFGNILDLSNDRIQGIKLQGNQVVVAGFATPLFGALVFQEFAEARYNLNNGQLDSTVAPDTGNGGRVTTDFFASSRSRAAAIALDANNNWVVVGAAGDGVFADNIALARFIDPPPTTVSVSSNVNSFSEAAGTVTVTAALNVRSLVPVTVNLNFGGSAMLTTDYTRSASQIVIPAGQLSRSITITGVPDLAVEGPETVTIGITGVTNATNVGTTLISLTEADANNAAPTDINLTNNTVAENQPNVLIGNLSAVDSAGDTHTFSIQAGGNGNLFTINGNQLRVGATGLNFEALGGSATVNIRVQDQGSLTFTKQFTITVIDVNEAPTITASGPFTIAENSANTTAVGTVGSTDPDGSAPFNTRNFSIASGNTNGAFAINASTGAITVVNSAALNFETTNSVTLTISLTDGGSPALSAANQTVTINVSDVNEAPTITASGPFTVAENSGNGTAVGTMGSSDPDGTAPNNTRNFSIASGNTNGAFSINSSTGAISVANPGALNFETTTSFTLIIALSDGGSPALSAANQTVTINVSDVNEAPTILANQAFSVPENSSNNTLVGLVGSNDPDQTAPNNSRTFTITGGNTGNAFSINPSNGQISVGTSSALNFEGISVFDLTVEVRDGGNLTGSGIVRVNLQNVNEAPTLGAPGAAAPFSKRAKIPSQVFPAITVNDPDGPIDLAKVTITVSLPKANNGLVQKKVKDLVSFDGASDLGTVSDTRNGTTRTITINLDPTTTSAAVQDFLRGIRFFSSGGSINAKNLTRAFSVRVEDAGGLFATKNQTVNVVG